MRQLAPELTELVLRKTSVKLCGRNPDIDAKLFELQIHDQNRFLDILVGRNAADSLTRLKDFLEYKDLKRCLRLAIKLSRVKVIGCLRNVKLTNSDFKHKITELARTSESRDLLKDVFKCLDLKPKHAEHVICSVRNTKLSAHDLMSVAKELGASLTYINKNITSKIFKEQDTAAVRMLTASFSVGDFSLDNASTEFDIDFLLTILESPLHTVLKGFHFKTILSASSSYAVHTEAIMTRLQNPLTVLIELIQYSNYDVAERLIHYRPDLVWPELDSHHVIFTYGKWPESLLDVYLSRTTSEHVALRTFYKPHMKNIYSTDVQTYAKITYKMIHACQRVGKIIDAEPDLALAWACQVGDVPAVMAHKDLVPLHSEGRSPFMDLARSWERQEVVDILQKELPFVTTSERYVYGPSGGGCQFIRIADIYVPSGGTCQFVRIADIWKGLSADNSA